jgi:hypothetical protein
MTETDVREFLVRMADEAGSDPLDSRPVVRKARRRAAFTVAGTLLAIGAVVAGGIVGANRLTTASTDRNQKPAVPRPTTSPDPKRVGFIGLPPEGAAPSVPERGQLVLYFFGGHPSGRGRSEIWLYADGRIIAERDANLPYGANRYSTGYLEQRLTPYGVELLRSEVVSNGFVVREPPLGSESVSPSVIVMQVRVGEQLVRVERARNVERLVARITDPASWLPASAWEDQEIRAYVPSKYAVCFMGPGGLIQPPEVMSLLPGSAEDLLRAKGRARVEGAVPDKHCYGVATEEARTLSEAFDHAGFEPTGGGVGSAEQSKYRLVYRVGSRGVYVYFEPILPHGEGTCSPCG